MSDLSKLNVGECAYTLSGMPLCERRLFELGLINKTRIECVAKAPFGDSKAYLIRGAVIALRPTEAESIAVEKITSAAECKHIYGTDQKA